MTYDTDLNDADSTIGECTVPLAAGYYYTCAITPDKSIDCWGSWPGTPSEVFPSGAFTHVTTSDWYACAANANTGALTCWGTPLPDWDYGQDDPPDGAYKMVSTGVYHACALDTAGMAVCWGLDSDGQASPPAGTFIDIGAGTYNNSCGVRPDGSIQCWGDLISPEGHSGFKSVSLGRAFACGIKTGGNIHCWGESAWWSDPPSGSFSQLDAGPDHACAVSNTGTLHCWGRDDRGQSSPPTGNHFRRVTADWYHSCAVTTDGSVECWGGVETVPDDLAVCF